MSNRYTADFHAELLTFLKSKTVDEGFSSGDPPFSRFQKEVLDASGQVFLETKLLNALSFEEFKELKWERWFPRMYRGFPRIYKQKDPSKSHIKKSFKSFEKNLSLVLEKPLFQLYRERKERGKILLFTWVMKDGFADYSAALDLFEILSKNPLFSVDWICLVPKQFAFAVKERERRLVYEKAPSLSLFSEEILSYFSQADLILQLPSYYPETKKLEEICGHKEFFSFGQYGCIESGLFDPASNNRSMGLHFLEKGILIKERPKVKRLKTPLLQKMMGEEEEELEVYLQTHRFYLAYLTSSSGGAVYLYALLKLLEGDPLPIDICVPDLSWFVDFLKERDGKELFQPHFKIASLEVHLEEGSYVYPIHGEGKILRFFVTGPISSEEFQVLLLLSEEFVAVRGDSSFSLAVSFGKTFFYDGRDFARSFIQDLLAIVENRLSLYPETVDAFRMMKKVYLHNLSKEGGEWIDVLDFEEREPLFNMAEKLGSLLREKRLNRGFQKLSKLVREEFSFADYIEPFIQRALVHKKEPESKEREEREVALFLKGGCSFKALVDRLRVCR